MGELQHFIMRINCPKCGSVLKSINEGQPTDGGHSVNAVVRCTNNRCKRELAVHVRLMSMGVYNDDGIPHGTSTAYRRHNVDGEPPCKECRDWHSRMNLDKEIARRAKEDASV